MSESCHGCGQGSPPAQAEEARRDEAILAETNTILRVAGMDCADEVEVVERVLNPLPGVGDVRINLMGGTVTVAHDRTVTAEQLVKAITDAGLKASSDSPKSGETDAASGAQRGRLVSVIASGLFTGLGLIFQWTDVGPFAFRIASFLTAIIAGGWFILPKAISAVRRLTLDMNVLMTVAVLGAAAIGEWREAAAVVFLFALSELLESFSVNRARRAIQSLLKLAPETALLKKGEDFEEVPVAEVEVGGVIAVKSGARAPLDGEVLSGRSAVNQAPITGESIRRRATPCSQEQSTAKVRWKCG